MQNNLSSELDGKRRYQKGMMFLRKRQASIGMMRHLLRNGGEVGIHPSRKAPKSLKFPPNTEINGFEVVLIPQILKRMTFCYIPFVN